MILVPLAALLKHYDNTIFIAHFSAMFDVNFCFNIFLSQHDPHIPYFNVLSI